MLVSLALAGCADTETSPMEQVGSSDVASTADFDASMPWEYQVARWEGQAANDDGICVTATPSRVCAMVCVASFGMSVYAAGDYGFGVEGKCGEAEAECSITDIIPFCSQTSEDYAKEHELAGSCKATGTNVNGMGICYSPVCNLLCGTMKAEMEAVMAHGMLPRDG